MWDHQSLGCLYALLSESTLLTLAPAAASVPTTTEANGKFCFSPVLAPPPTGQQHVAICCGSLFVDAITGRLLPFDQRMFDEYLIGGTIVCDKIITHKNDDINLHHNQQFMKANLSAETLYCYPAHFWQMLEWLTDVADQMAIMATSM